MNDDVRFRALGNGNRRRLLTLVRDDAQTVGALANALAISQPAVSQHLAVLRDAGLVVVEPRGKQRFYRADETGLRAAASFFQTYWDDAIDRLASVAEDEAASRAVAS